MYRRRNAFIIAATALALALPAAAEAKNKHSKSKHGAYSAHRHVAACPPGLAKKNPPCVPPGQAKKHYGHDHDHVHDGDHHHHVVGNRVTDDYILIPNPARYGLDPAYLYYRFGGDVFRVDRETREVINFIGAAAALLN